MGHHFSKFLDVHCTVCKYNLQMYMYRPYKYIHVQSVIRVFEIEVRNCLTLCSRNLILFFSEEMVVVACMCFMSLLAMMVVLSEEPQDCDDQSAEEDKKHLDPVVNSLVKLSDDDLTAGDVDEGTAGKAHEDRVDKRVALSDCHANQYTDRCC